MLEVNCIHYVLLTKYFINKLVNRKLKRSAIIYVSSISSDLQMPGVGVYGATKAFEEYWAKYVAAEY